jgi:integrase
MTARGLSEFVKQYTKKGSISANQAGVVSFLEFIYGEQPGVKDGLTKKDQLKTYNDLSIKYIKDESRDRLNDATTFATSLAGSPPMTARSRLSAVRNFLGYNNIEISDKQWERVTGKLPKGNARTIEIEIDVVTVRQVLEHADIKMKALVTFLVSSGCRLNEALGLFMEDVSFDGDKVAKITIRGELTKTGIARDCYCSTESVRYLKEWLKIRAAYMKSAQYKSNGLGSERPAADTDNRLFPFTDHTAIVSWNTIAAKAGFGATDRSTGRKTLHLHMMRKLFRSQLALKVPVDVVEALMGHSAYLSEVYRRFTKKQIRELYEKGSPVLHVFGDADISEVREQLETTTKDLKETKSGQEKTAAAQTVLVLENQELKTQLADMRTEFDTRLNLIEKIEREKVLIENTPQFKIAYAAAMAALQKPK